MRTAAFLPVDVALGSEGARLPILQTVDRQLGGERPNLATLGLRAFRRPTWSKAPRRYVVVKSVYNTARLTAVAQSGWAMYRRLNRVALNNVLVTALELND